MRPVKHLKKKKKKPEESEITKKMPEESDFSKRLRITKERQSKMEPEMTTMSEQLQSFDHQNEQRFETPDQSLRPQLAHASDIIAKMRQYSSNIYQIMAIPEVQSE